MKPLSLYFLLLLLAITTLHAKTPENAPIKVFLFAGQSNMDGIGEPAKFTQEDKARLAKARQRVSLAFNGSAPVPLAPTEANDWVKNAFHLEETFGPELFFGLEIAEAYPDERFLFIKRSVGNTSLYGCWNPNWTLEKATVTKEQDKPKLYSEFIDFTYESLRTLQDDEYEICGMLWVQGEFDSSTGLYGNKPAETYGENLTHLISSVRTEFGKPHLPFILLEVGSGKVVDGMIATEKNVKNVTLIRQSKDPESPDFLPQFPAPLYHYNYIGMKRIGTKFGEAFLSDYSLND